MNSTATPTAVVNPIELIKQVVDNINAQLQPLDIEIGNASQGDSSYVNNKWNDEVHAPNMLLSYRLKHSTTVCMR